MRRVFLLLLLLGSLGGPWGTLGGPLGPTWEPLAGPCGTRRIAGACTRRASASQKSLAPARDEQVPPISHVKFLLVSPCSDVQKPMVLVKSTRSGIDIYEKCVSQTLIFFE